MPLSVDWSTSPYRITCPQSELTFVSGTKYQITVDYLWQLLRDFSDSPGAIPFPRLYTNTPPTASTPRIIEVDADYYDFQFEDGLYSVEIVNGNSNIRDVEVKNQVSVGTNNTTGFINPTFLEAGLFAGEVTVDVVNGIAGIGYTAAGGIIGTRATPSNNISDATTIAMARNIDTLYIIGDITLDTGDDISGYTVFGQSRSRTLITVNPGATTDGAVFGQARIQGTLDNDATISNCRTLDVTYFNGRIESCQLAGTITLAGGAQADLIDCSSGVAGGSQTPTLNMGGSGQALTIRNYSGGLKLVNKTGTDSVSIDLTSGQVQVDLATVTNGPVTVRGTGKVVSSTDTEDHLPHGMYGALYLDNETTFGKMLQELWALQGLDPDAPMTVTPSTRTAGALTLNLTGDGVSSTTVTRA